MSFDRVRYDIRLMGWLLFLTPIMLVVGFALFAGLLHFLGINPVRFLSAGLEMFLPVALGLITAMSCLNDPVLEVQLTLPRPYGLTVLYRHLLALGWAMCVALTASALLTLFHLEVLPDQLQSWSPALRFLAGQLTWLAPLLWFVSLSMCITFLTHSRTASSALLGGIWLVEVLFFRNLLVGAGTQWLQPLFLFPTTLTPASPFWLSARIEQLLMALILFALSWLLMRNSEGLLKGASHD